MRLLLFLLALSFFACRKAPDTIPLPTKICVATSHHGYPIPNATVYVKFNADSFPGYPQPPSYYDATFKTDADAYGCIESVPEGTHWLVGFGYDSIHYPHEIFGSIKLEVDLKNRPVRDTILYLSEQH
jgi:hypothetical protein